MNVSNPSGISVVMILEVDEASTLQAGVAQPGEPPSYPSTGSRSDAGQAAPCSRYPGGMSGSGRLPDTGISGNGAGQLNRGERNRTRNTWDDAGNPIRDTWDKMGRHTREQWDRAGRYVRDSVDGAGNPTRDTWDAAGRHIRGIRAKDGNHVFRVDDGSASRRFSGGGDDAPRGAVGAAHGPAREPVIDGFNAEQRLRLQNAYQNTKQRVDATLDALMTRGPDRQFERWFGTPTPESMAHVKQVLSNMQHALAHDQYTLRAMPSSGRVGAHVWPEGPHLIEMTPLVFGNAYGAKTLELTLAHELSHVKSIGNTRDLAYFPANDRRLARTNSRAALDNADNYGMFINGM